MASPSGSGIGAATGRAIGIGGGKTCGITLAAAPNIAPAMNGVGLGL
jgi:hypothetical protein